MRGHRKPGKVSRASKLWRRPRVIISAALVVLLAGAVSSWVALDPGFRGADQQMSLARDPASMDEFDRRVRAFILNNPQVLIDSVQGMSRKRAETRANDIRTIIASRRDEILNDANSPATGNPNGDVTLVEFFDYNCPYCRAVAPVTREALRTDPRLRLVYKEWPILGAGSIYAARAALAANRQGKYLEFHEAMMTASGRVNKTSVLALAEKIGIDVARLKKDIEDPAIKDMLRRNVALARALRLTGTPSFVIGQEILRGATDIATLRKRIARARKQAMK
jgi:protein-disulfide isomerase